MIVSSNIRSKVRTAIALLHQKLSGNFSSLLPHMEFLLSEAVPIAGISYNHVRAHIYLNPSWLEAAHESEVAGVLLHEALHFVFGHKYREKALPPHLRPANSIESMLFNICADYAINELVWAMGFPLPKGGVDFKTLKDIAKQLGVKLTDEEEGKPTEYYYTKFIHALRQNPSIALNLPQNFDEHIDDPEFQEQEQEQEKSGQGQKQGQGQKGQEGKEGQDEQGQEGQEGQGQGKEGQEGQGKQEQDNRQDSGQGQSASDKLDRLKAHMDELKENLLRELRGKLKGQGKEGLGDIIKLDSERRKVRVESVEDVLRRLLLSALKRMVKEGDKPVDLSKRTKRNMALGKETTISYRFNHEPKGKLRLAFVADTSGSMSPEEVGDFLDMLVSLINRLNRFARSRFDVDLNRFLEITYIEADAKVAEKKVFSEAAELLRYVKHKDSYKGGGGTSFKPALEEVLSLEKPPAVVVYFTDGEECGVKNYLPEMAKVLEEKNISLVFTLTQRGTEDALKQALEECHVGNISLTRFERESPAVGIKP